MLWSGSLCSALLGMAQQGNAIHFSPLHFEQVATPYDFPPAGFDIGFDHDLGTNLSMSVAMSFYYRDVLPTSSGLGGGGNQWTTAGITIDYGADVHQWSLIYRSAYFPKGNDELIGFYIGDYVGIRGIQRFIDVGSQWGRGPYVFRDHYDASAIVFPIGLRTGWRLGSIDVFFMDFYVTAGYQINGGRAAFAEPELNGIRDGLAGFTYGLGLAYGIGI